MITVATVERVCVFDAFLLELSLHLQNTQPSEYQKVTRRLQSACSLNPRGPTRSKLMRLNVCNP